ncbi:MAG: hypothetical protein AAF587_40935 [Bacteroidota bacterium]
MKTHSNTTQRNRSAAEPEQQQEEGKGSFLTPPVLQFSSPDPPESPEETIEQDPSEETPQSEELDQTSESENVPSSEVPLADQISVALEEKKMAAFEEIQAMVLAKTTTETDRQDILNNTKLMKKVRKTLHPDDYLKLLTDLRMFKTPTNHQSPEEADSLVQKHLAIYIRDAMVEGRQIEGRVAVVDDVNWDRAGTAHYGKDWGLKRSKVDGFVDSMGKAWIHMSKGDKGTMIHEAIHIYSTSRLASSNHNLNEGMAEYFTRIVCQKIDPSMRHPEHYKDQYSVVKSLVGVVTEPVLARAFFDKKMSDMIKAFQNVQQGIKWIDFANAMKEGDWIKARRLCQPQNSP